MAEVTIEVGGRRYDVACRDGEEPQLRRLAMLVDQKAEQARGAVGTNANESRLLLLADLATTIGYDGRDFVLLADGRLARAKDRAEPPWGYMGVQIVHPRLFADAPEGAFSTNIVWNRAIAAGRLFGTVLDGVWLHVGTPQARDEAESYLTEVSSA